MTDKEKMLAAHQELIDKYKPWLKLKRKELVSIIRREAFANCPLCVIAYIRRAENCKGCLMCVSKSDDMKFGCVRISRAYDRLYQMQFRGKRFYSVREMKDAIRKRIRMHKMLIEFGKTLPEERFTAKGWKYVNVLKMLKERDAR